MKFQRRRELAVKRVADGLLFIGPSSKVIKITGRDADISEAVVEFLDTNGDSQALEDYLVANHGVAPEESKRLIVEMWNAGLFERAPSEATWPASEIEKRRPQINFFSQYFDREEQFELIDLISRATVAIVGSGAIGATIGKELALLGIGNIHLFCSRDPISADEARSSSIFAAANAGDDRAAFLKESLAVNETTTTIQAIDSSDLEKEIEVFLNQVRPDLFVLALEQTTHEFLNRFNALAVVNGLNWLLCANSMGVGQVISFLPKITACYHCLSKRQESNTLHFEELVSHRNASELFLDKGVGFHPLIMLICSLATTELIKLLPLLNRSFEEILELRAAARTFEEYNKSITRLRFGMPDTWGNLVTLEVSPFRVTKRQVLKLPRCSVCGVNSQTVVPTLPWDPPI
jgi:molybdopterin/thiamine biosynthesis adenylyltransferase